MSNLVIPDGGNIGSASDTDAIAISSGGNVTLSQTLDGGAIGSAVTMSANQACVKTALNASGNPPIYACRAWVNFRGTIQSGTATASGLVSGEYTATVTSATQFTVVYSSTTYTINTTGNHEIAGGAIGESESVDLTVSGTSVTIDTQIRASGNVSSITDAGTGYYKLNFTTAMPDANYATLALSSRDNSTDQVGMFVDQSTYSTTQVGVTELAVSTFYDVIYATVAIFR